ncbi:glycosyltransferase family 2 protein [Desulfopila sp. IMCC35006]|uniref:glycosyltransferase family 2 protein n=1 Tax=Desulfopila sp. IMCC35006 TaxID=2569542 RepID=UPI00197A7DB4|nr:glycosyltransferase family 2 protein [Desulfopila sp. IMCC35006]
MKKSKWFSLLKQPLISVITVVFNGADTIENTFASVFSQDFDDFEYIVVDGGSKDDTVDIIKRNESNLAYWVSETDKGVYDAMNKAVHLAKGKWIYFLGADDVLYNILAKMASYLVDETTIYYGDVFRPFAKRRYDGQFSALKLSFRNICHQSIFYPRYVFEKYSYDLNYPLFSDYELNMRCYADRDLRFEYVPLTIAIYNDVGGLSQSKDDASFITNKMSLIKRYFPYYVFYIVSVRFVLIQTLVFFKIDKLAMSMHHYYLRVLRRRTDPSFQGNKK